MRHWCSRAHVRKTRHLHLGGEEVDRTAVVRKLVCTDGNGGQGGHSRMPLHPTQKKFTREVLVEGADAQVIAVLDFALDRGFLLGQQLQESGPAGGCDLRYP